MTAQTVTKYSMSNVIMADEKLALFHQYLGYRHKCGPLCSVHQAPSDEPNLTLQAWFLRDLAYLSMLFILQVLEHLKNK